MTHEVDLSALRIDAGAPPVPRRPLGPRLLVLAVLALLLAVAATFLWPLLRPVRAVRMAAVRPAGATATTASVATAEAVGWVEADPFPVVVRPLVAGRIETLEVLEGAVLRRGETVVARLASAMLLAAHDRAAATVAEREAALASARASHRLAAERREQNADARLRAADATAKLAMLDTRLASAREQVLRAESMLQGAVAAVTAQEQLAAAGSTYPVALERARAEADAARAALAAARAEVDGLARERAATAAVLALSEELLRTPVELVNAVAIATTDVQRAEAMLATARTELAVAERELGWATVTAPVDGVVMKLLAMPGDTVGPGGQGIVSIYDPARLRARIDVPLDSIGAVHDGQAVEITSQALGSAVVRGVVQRLQHESDLLKNTLQVKIGLIDPPALLRPETLCRARFLAPERAPGGEAAAVTAFRVPAAAVQDRRVFVFDPSTGTARAVPVEVVGEDGDARVVRGELSVTQRVVIEPVAAGEAVREIER